MTRGGGSRGVAALAAIGLAALWWVGRQVAPPPLPPPAPTCADCHAEQASAWAGSHHAAAQRSTRETVTLDGVSWDAVGRIGVAPLQQWLVDRGHGDLHVTQAAWDVGRSEVFDVFGDGREAGEWGHWTGEGMAWNRSCAPCHVTGFVKGWDGYRYASTWLEEGVGCPACHVAEGPPGPGHASVGADTDSCAPCHARRAELVAAPDPRAPFLDGYVPALVDAGPSYWADGRVRDELFEWGAFVGSRMHEVGVRCVDCHDPHSGRLRRDGDALCAGCHAALPAHDGHAGSVTCVDCHMPVTVYMMRHPRHDHGFPIPDPALAAEIGAPDPCVGCHEGEDTVAKAGRLWAQPGGPRERALAVQAARRGSDEAVPALLDQLAAGRAAWRGTAARLLAPWADRPEVRQALVAAASDPDDLVRLGALEALGPVDPAAMRVALDDRRRAVRITAARALGPDLPWDRVAEYEATLAHNADQPEALIERGMWRLRSGAAGPALEDLRKAVVLDPRRPDAREALAVALSSVGRGAEAARELEAALAVLPDEGELWLSLGLARAEIGDVMGAEAALERASQAGVARGAYNLGLLLAQREAWDDALRALFRAQELEDGVEVRYAIASLLWRGGRRDEAKIAAKRVMELSPEHPGARAMLR